MRRKKTVAAEDLLTPKETPAGTATGGTPVPLPASAPLRLAYTPLTETAEWRVEKFELLASEFQLAGPDWAKAMGWFHELAAAHTRKWHLARLLFGIGPMILPDNARPEDYAVKSREEICAQFGFGPKDLQSELDVLRVVWREAEKVRGAKDQVSGPKVPGVKSGPPHLAPDTYKSDTLPLADELLERHGFDPDMFNIMMWEPVKKEEVPRAASKNRLEQNWFTQRVADWEKMLNEPMASAIVREALLNELYLRRVGAEMSVVSPSTGKYRDLADMKSGLEASLQKQMEKLKADFPQFNIADKLASVQLLSNLNRAYRDYYGRADRRLVDKLNTAPEIEVLLRMSVQSPEPQYRMGLNVAIVENMHGLYDPDFRPQFKQSTLKLMDAGFKGGVTAMREQQALPLVDLERGVMPDEGDNYPDLEPDLAEVEA